MGAPSGLSHGRDVFRMVHVVALTLCAVALPWSKAVLSMAQMLLLANWLVEGVVRADLKGRFLRAFTTAPQLVFLSLFALHVVGLLWTDDTGWGTSLVRILLPVLVFGVVLGSVPRLAPGELRWVLLAGAWSVVASTVVSLVARKGITSDYRSLAVFVSHIRLTLLLCLAVVVFVWDRGGPAWSRILGYLAAAWSIFFIDRLGSIQGQFIMVVIAMVFLWRGVGRYGRALRLGVRALLVLAPLALLVIGWVEVRHRYRLPDTASIIPFERTPGGEYYQHDLNNPQQENGHHVWTYVAMDELKRGWARRSDRSFDGRDEKGHDLWSTLVRYMASKGLRKDSVGLMVLTDADIRAVERGQTNAHPDRWGGVSARFDEVVFELQQYHAMGAADGHSVSMRLEYLRTGLIIAKENWSCGVGTGDTEQEFQRAYERSGTRLSPKWRHRAHDQYLTWWISFGVVGMLWCLFAIVWPAHMLGAWRSPLFIAWAIIFGISCLTDDTLETQVGATFFALYYTLFVFAAPSLNGSAPRRSVPSPA